MAHNLDALQIGLERAIAGSMDALSASPGAAYLTEHGISLDVALKLGIGWGTRGALAGRIVFPLCGPDGHPTSAIGQRIHKTDDRRNPKHKTLDGKAGYIKPLFNGGAVTSAWRTGHPLIVVEGPLDAAACVAAGLPLTVAIGSTSYAHPEHFSDLSTVILALDSDDAGREGRRRLWLELSGRGIEVLSLPAMALDGCKDLGEYWQRHRTMFSQLMARSIGLHRQLTMTTPPAMTETLPSADDTSLEHIGSVKVTARLSLINLPVDLRAEALGIELAADLKEYRDYGQTLSVTRQRFHLKIASLSARRTT